MNTRAFRLAILALIVASAALLHAQLGRTTPFFTCGSDETLPDAIPLRWDTLALAGDGRLYSPCPSGLHTDKHREAREGDLLRRALQSRNPQLRRLAVQIYGRLLSPVSVLMLLNSSMPGGGILSTTGPIQTQTATMLLDDADPGVRRELANALGDLLSSEAEIDPQLNARARLLLTSRLVRERDSNVAATILETLGRMKHPDDAATNLVEALLLSQPDTNATRLVGATRGLEALIHNNAGREVSNRLRERVRQLAVIGPTQAAVPTIAGPGTANAPGDEESYARVRRLAVSMMATIQDDHLETLVSAAHDADWQVRRFVAARADITEPEFMAMFPLLAADAAFQVRYEAAAALARLAVNTHDCRRLFAMVGDAQPVVAMRAIDLLPEKCANQEQIVAHLVTLTEHLRDSGSGSTWQIPARALVALARLDPARARPLLDEPSQHPDWRVRAATATAAGHLGDAALLVTLADDREPNVRTAVLEAMVASKSPAVIAAAIDALRSDDNQLLRTAAMVLEGCPEADRVDASNALLLALFRVTRAAKDTSREPRAAMIERFLEIAPIEFAGQLSLLGADFDRTITTAVTLGMANVYNVNVSTARAAKSGIHSSRPASSFNGCRRRRRSPSRASARWS